MEKYIIATAAEFATLEQANEELCKKLAILSIKHKGGRS